jgi:predicted enzyme related to lactoylglutathione lyase
MHYLARHILLLTASAVLVAVPALAQDKFALPPLNARDTGIKLPGKFIWFDLATPALADQQEFYSDVFGWTYQSPGQSSDNYVLVLNQGRAIGGMFASEPPGGEQDGATWITLFSVEDVDQATRDAVAAGGNVELKPADVPRRGRHALLRDPGNALFGVLDSSSGDPADDEVPIGGIFWVDLFTRDVDGMIGFYSKLAPYESRLRGMIEGSEGQLLVAHDLPRAGVVPVDEEANRSAWVPYVRVADVQAALDRAEKGGGFTIIAPDPEILESNLGVFVDPHGGVMGVVKYDYDEAAGAGQ